MKREHEERLFHAFKGLRVENSFLELVCKYKEEQKAEADTLPEFYNLNKELIEVQARMIENTDQALTALALILDSARKDGRLHLNEAQENKLNEVCRQYLQ